MMHHDRPTTTEIYLNLSPEEVLRERRLGADHAATRTVRDRLVALSTPHNGA